MKKVLRIIKKILIVMSLLSCAVLFVIVLTSAVKTQDKLRCKGIEVKIDRESGIAFLNEAEIKFRIHYLNGGNTVGMLLSQIDFRRLEHDLLRNPFVEGAQVFVDQSETIHVNIIQRRPILRVINTDGVSYYIGEKNERIPLCDKFTMHLPVAVGKVETRSDLKRDSMVQEKLYKLTQFIRKDEFLSAVVDQIDVEENGDFNVIPKIQGHIIRLGDASDFEDKFQRLKVFYKEGFARVGWDKYQCIDLRFRDQVVAIKTDNSNTSNDPQNNTNNKLIQQL